MSSDCSLGSTQAAGSPRFLGHPFDARCLLSPRRVQPTALHPFPVGRWQASPSLEGWPPRTVSAHPRSRNEAEIEFDNYGSRLRLGRLRTDELLRRTLRRLHVE